MLKALLAIGGLQLVTMLILLVRTKVLALLLGPDAVGVLAVIDKLVAVLVQTTSLSLPFAAIRFLPALWHGDRAGFYRMLRAMTAVLAATALATLAVGLIISALRPELWGSQFARYRSVVLLAMLTIPAAAFIPFVQNAIAGALQPRNSMLFAVAHAGIQCVTGLIGGVLRSLGALYASYAAAAAALAGGALWGLLRKTRTSAPTRGRWIRELLPPPAVWRFSAFLAGLAFLAPYAALYAHYLVLSRYGAATAGWMQAAIGIGLAVRAVLGSAHQVFLTPQINRGRSPAEQMQWTSQFQSTWCLLAGIVVPPLLLAPNLFVQLLYARTFTPGAQFVYLFVLTEVLTLLAGSLQAIVIASDRLVFHVSQNMAAQLLSIFGAWLLVPRFGIGGAALAALAAQVLLYLCSSIFLSRAFGLRTPLRTTTLTLYLMLALTAAGIAGARGLTLAPMEIARAVAFYAAIIGGLALFLTREDWARLIQLARRPEDPQRAEVTRAD
jgi:PST family polysaccharide transporter